ANFWDIPNVEAMLAGIRGIDALLPEGVENWRVANTGWTPPNPVAPFQPHAYWDEIRRDKSGVNKAYAALAPDGRWIQMPCGVLGYVDMVASYDLADVKVFDPLTCTELVGLVPTAYHSGDHMTLPGRDDSMTAYIIQGRTA